MTSGAIARGTRELGLTARPSAIEELQAASAVGQGRLYRVYDEFLASRGVLAAQVLLTFSDVSARESYLNARQTLGKLLEWGAVPVVNENDTTATDEITFGDNDFLAAQIAILVGADRLVILTNSDGLHTADPRLDPTAALVERVEDFAALDSLAITQSTSAHGSGGHALEGRRGRHGDGGRHRDGDLLGGARRRARPRACRRARGDRVRARAAGATRASSCGCATRSRAAA